MKKNENIGDYELIKLLGRGGMGEVWLVKKEGIEYAMKFCNSGEESDLSRFKREFRLMSQLDHPNVLKAFATGEHEGIIYIVMEKGEADLQTYVPKGLSMEEKFSYAKQICDAVHYIHCAGETHRDIKASNVLLKDGNCKIADFGLGRFMDRDTITITTTGEHYHSHGYDAPELLDPGKFREGSVAIDIYALGSLLFYIFSDGAEPAFFNTKMIPADIAPILIKCREYDPNDRYESAEKVGCAISKVQASRNVYKTLGELWRDKNKCSDKDLVDYALPIIYSTDNLEDLIGNIPIITKIVPLMTEQGQIEALCHFIIKTFNSNPDSYHIPFEDIEWVAELGIALLRRVRNNNTKVEIFNWAFSYSLNYLTSADKKLIKKPNL